jgi:hypothetical protein
MAFSITGLKNKPPSGNRKLQRVNEAGKEREGGMGWLRGNLINRNTVKRVTSQAL